MNDTPEQTRTGFSFQTLLLVSALVGAGAFAAGRGFSTHGADGASTTIVSAATAAPIAAEKEELPASHPAFDPMTSGGLEKPAESNLAYKAPARWKAVPSQSTMRLATYRIPKVAGDAEDPEIYLVQAGGSLDDNIERWVGQYGAEGRRTLKRSKKKVNGLDVTFVELQGSFDGGMSNAPRKESGWGLYGVIVETPGMPHFFKMTGPVKSVTASHADVDQLVASFALL